MTEYTLRRDVDGFVGKATADRALAVAAFHEADRRGWTPVLLARTSPDGAWTEQPAPVALVFAPTSRYLVRGRH